MTRWVPRLGVVGGGQLGRMLALAGTPMGVAFRFLDPDPHCPASAVGELVVGAYDDPAALAKLAAGCDAVTYEFENVPAAAAEWLCQHVPGSAVFPPAGALAVSQDRLSEKALFRELGIAVPEHAAVDSHADLVAAVGQLGTPCVLKTRRMGYDGKGQCVIRAASEIDSAWASLAGESARPAGLILEAFVPFAREVSVIGVRARDGAVALYPPIANHHVRGILSRSVCPAPGMTPERQAAYHRATRLVLDRLSYVGVLTIEFFELADGSLLANEMAPRVHNSGHWTIEGAECSQFDNHVRVVLGLPLGSTALRGASVLLNVIGAEPDVRGLLALPGVHVHMYGKQPRAGRKLGHVTVCGADAEAVHQLAAAASARVR
jgi:5-(carboxyamino)imidazole ribonucleotide synthase